MALITWQDLLDRAENTKGESPITANSAEYKKAFNHYIKKHAAEYKTLPKEVQVRRITDLIRLNLKDNKGKFVPGVGYKNINVDPKLKWDELVKKPGFKDEFQSFLNRSEDTGIKAIAKKRIPLKDKYNALDHWQKTTARKAVDAKLLTKGMISMTEFAPLTNFTRQYLSEMINMWDKPSPKITRDGSNLKEAQLIARAKDFKEFFKDNNIEVFRKPKVKGQLVPDATRAGNIFFTDVSDSPSQLKALTGFLNLGKIPSSKLRNKAVQLSKDHPLYEDTGRNFRKFLEAAKNNINTTIEGYNDKGLRKFLTEHPKIFKNATAIFDPGAGRVIYTPISDIYKKGYNLSKLRQNLKLEIEHNRAIEDYWKNLTKDGKINAKNRLLFDAEFGHNLSLDTAQYNKSLKRSMTSWIESPLNKNKTTQIAALEKEMADLGHRFYAGGKWRGRDIQIKPGYRDTVVNSWKQAIEGSTGLKWNKLVQDKSLGKSLTKAMEDVALDSKQLRILGNMFGCPGTFKYYEEGGRVRLQAGGQGLANCVSTKLKQPGAMEKIALEIPEEAGGALSRLKNTATNFLQRPFVKGAGRFGAIAAVGAAGAGLVKTFMNDDPTTYLSDENQQKNMLIEMITDPMVDKPDPTPEILDYQLPVLGATAAAGTAVTAPSTIEAARSGALGAKKSGITKTALKTLGRGLAATGTPLGLLALEPLHIAGQVEAGDSLGEIATNPWNYAGLAFADDLTKFTTKGLGPNIAKAVRLGISPAALRIGSRFLGLPGLALSLGISGYEMYDDYKKKRGMFSEE